jgi:hypothetical protein
MLLMFYPIEEARAPNKGPTDLTLFAPAMLALMLGTAPALAEVEQCRFIQAKPDRETCYGRQEAALAEKRKQEATRASENSKGMESLEQMKHEDMELNRQLHNICRGC